MKEIEKSEFKKVFTDVKWSDDFYRFLQIIFHLYPEDKFHHLIQVQTLEEKTDEAIYKSVQAALPKIKPFLSELTFALPALKKQKREMGNQIKEIFGARKDINGYFEIGSTGRYVKELKKQLTINGNIYISNDQIPDNSIAEIFERGQIGKVGNFFTLSDYDPIPNDVIQDSSVDLVSCLIGMHHCPSEKFEAYIKSIHRILRKDGLFILRDHDVKSDEMSTFVSLVHTVFNLGLNVDWETNEKEFKSFKSIEEWSSMITKIGFEDSGIRILQENDPSLNTLVSFKKL